jgi:DNA-binding beta-propeller fold protein YncE/mono/diheme cytochrome c family protein
LRKFKQLKDFLAALAILGAVLPRPTLASYVNFESSHVHPIDLTPSGGRLLAVNTPDAVLEVFSVGAGGSLTWQNSIPVGLEPVTVVARTETEAWVVNHLSDSISIVDLNLGAAVRTLEVGDEPTDVVFANGRAFVAVSQEDAVKVFDLTDLSVTPINLFSSDTRALAVSKDGSMVYAVALNSGNQTTVVNANIIASGGTNSGLNATRLASLGLNDMTCNGAAPSYPPLPGGIQRNPTLTDPPSGVPPVGLIVRWDQASGAWRDEAGQNWTQCLPFRLPDHDLFVINTVGTPGVVARVDHLGTTLFEVSVNPASGKVYVPNTEARNFVRFEHALGVRGHMVDNRLSVVDPSAGNAVRVVDLNAHIDRNSDPATNLLERVASLSQPGMMVWNSAGTVAYLTAIGSRKLFRLSQACLDGPGPNYGACIFGPTRALPDAVVVGEGPTGVALHEGTGRAFVLNRFSNSIAVVNVATMTKVREVALHDPSSQTVRQGRRLLYDGIDTSGHGDAACSSCHVSGNMDELAWDLGDPTGALAPYGTPGDNVRFIVPAGNQPTECNPAICAAHDGFDPQKGPMATQTLRGMLEPLHWRGDRPTMNAFNKAFVGLMGTDDIGPINGEPAGLTPEQMELYRQFALGIAFPPNPYRNVDDSLPNTDVSIAGIQFPGNPAAGETVFNTGRTDAGQACASCHALPFGAAGGKLGGVGPGDPSAARTALFNGNADGSPHSDLEVPHTRNMYEKFGPRFGSHTNPGDPPADQKTGFGYTHDGSIPDLGTFLSAGVFTVTPQQVRDLTMFMVHFPTEIKPSVGRELTVPAGGAAGTPAQEQLLATLISLGNLADAGRHCELVASARSGGRLRTWSLNGGIGTGGLWTTDVAGESQVSTAALRQGASDPVTFLCATLGSGLRLGGDRDLDTHLNGDDCADGDAATFAPVTEVTGLSAGGAAPTSLAWDDQSSRTGVGAVLYDVVGGSISDLRTSGLTSATSCLAGDVQPPAYDDTRAAPPVGEGYFYLTRARNSCGSGGFGPGQSSLDALTCSPP